MATIPGKTKAGQSQPKHGVPSAKERTVKHAAKMTPVGRVGEVALSGVEKQRAKREKTKEARNTQKALVSKNVSREQARITAANQLIRRPRVRMLAAEYIVAIFLAIIALFWGTGSYHDRIGKFFLQVTGLSALFFILALTSNSERASRAAIMFGALIDVVLLLSVTKKVTPNLTKTGSPATIPASDMQDYNSSDDSSDIPSFAQLAQLGNSSGGGNVESA